MENDPLDRVLRTALSREDCGPADVCPDDNKMAAYLDAALPPDERAELESHVARCSSCREALALSMRLAGEQAAAGLGQAGTQRRVLFHVQIPVAALSLVVIAAVAAALYFRVGRESARPNAPSQTAELHPPVPTVSESAASSAITASPPALPASAKQVPHRAKNVAVPQPPPPSAVAVGPAPVADLRQSEPPAKPEKEDRLTAQRVAFAEADASRATIANGQNAPTPKAAAEVSPGLEHKMPRARSAAGPPSVAGAGPATAKVRAIGGRTFEKVNGVWVDDECGKHADAPAIELKPDSDEYATILQAYPGVDELRPLVIFWKGQKVSIR